jgi:transposase
VLKVFQKTAVSARRVALQMIKMNIISAPNELRDQLLQLTRMQLIRTLATWRSDISGYCHVKTVVRILLKSLARGYLELHDEIADLNVMITGKVHELTASLPPVNLWAMNLQLNSRLD